MDTPLPMVHAECPFCHKDNVVGPVQEKRPNEPYALTEPCPHVVFVAVTNYLAAEYVHKEFGIEFGKVPGSYGHEAELEKILSRHFAFRGPVGFAQSKKAEDAARKEVADFLRARKFILP